jgi:hypothetical protein
MPIIVRFPVDPASIPNDSQPKCEADCEILMQGHRRSLSDWLVIAGKSYDEWLALYSSGLGKKQALIHGLPIDAGKLVDRDLLTYAEGNPYPERLSQFDLRRGRVEAWLAKYSSLDDLERRFWTRALLTSCYESWRKGEPWRPTLQYFFPWTDAIPATVEERSVFRAVERCPLVSGNLREGYWATPTLEQYFVKRVKEKGVAIHSWRSRFATLPDEPCTLSAIAKLLSIHRFTLYRSFKRKGIDTGGTRTKAEWLRLAIKCDETRSTKGDMMKNRTRGNIRRYA